LYNSDGVFSALEVKGLGQISLRVNHPGKTFVSFRQWFLCSRRKRNRVVCGQGKRLYISKRCFSALEGQEVGQFSLRENIGIVSKVFSLLLKEKE
jgi:hypothetical protein